MYKIKPLIKQTTINVLKQSVVKQTNNQIFGRCLKKKKQGKIIKT